MGVTDGDGRDDPEAGDLPGSGPPARFRNTALASSLVDATAIDSAEEIVRSTLGEGGPSSRWDQAVADVLVERGTLTRFQATQMLAGRRKLTLGQYRILDVLGQGGMGQVFRAEHAMMGREVAVKVLPRAKSTPDTEAAFQREIRMLGRLDHPNLVRALDAGHDGKVFYLVTELVEGVDLRKQVLKYGTLDEVAAAAVVSQVARGLAYAHVEGLVHRDVKPGNILVTPAGRAKLLDVGLAGSVLESESTRLGRVVGTMDYMAPEQIRSPDTVGPAADVYGLGCTLYFVLAGQVPFPGGTRQEKARRQLTELPAPIQKFAPGVSDAFCRVVEAMMDKDPVQRIGTADAVIEWLRPWTPDAPVPMGRRARTKSSKAASPTGFPAGPGSERPGSERENGDRGETALSGGGSSGYPSGIQTPHSGNPSSRRSAGGRGDSVFTSSAGGEGPSGWEWPSPPPIPSRGLSPLDAIRGFFLGGPERVSGQGRPGNVFVLAVSAGLAGAAAVTALRLFVPGLAGLLPAFAGPLVCGGLAFLATLVMLLSGRSGGEEE
ncbi:MAG: serine/threonine-protein kinase [Planctomycetota bacterium]|nr:serine/threonine-protein kinase [Planctomycetota bacterium]